ncbi:hypothetical protein KA478_03200 [Patescibacteria group bacterium]|nr:hypothetical protein [Patescibacteria group bacterium]
MEDKEALTETMTTRTVQYITRNMEAIVRTHKKAIDAEMSANGLVLVDEDNDPLPYTDYYLNL